MAIVGSGIMGERLSGGNIALALLCNSIATGGALAALILAFGNASGAHFNPVVTISEAVKGSTALQSVPAYLVGQFGGGLTGVALANSMFGLPPYSLSTRIRSGIPQFVSEIVATIGLLIIIHYAEKSGVRVAAIAVAAYITAAYWFVPSTAFANPAVTLARALTNTFSGIRPADTPGFFAAQLIGAGLATGFTHWISTGTADQASKQTANL